MSWLLMPGILFLVLAVLWLLYNTTGLSFGVIFGVFAVIFILSLLFCPANYYGGINRTIRAEQYYTNVVLPNKVSETAEYVVVTNPTAGIWQAGDYTLSDYNAALAQARYWRSVPVLGSAVYPMPDYLKYARVEGGQK